MNDNNLMAKRNANGLVDWHAEAKERQDAQKTAEDWEDAQFNTMNNGMLVRRDQVAQRPQDANSINQAMPRNNIGNTNGSNGIDKSMEIDFSANAQINANADMNAKPVNGKSIADVTKVTRDAQTAARQSIEEAKAKAVGAAAPNAKSAQQSQNQDANASSEKLGGKQAEKTADKPAEKPAEKPAVSVSKIKTASSPDALAQAYMNMFKSHFDLELSQGICFENMRKICEPNIKDPTKSLYFIENTYRFSTLAYIASNLPIMIITSILAEKNRKGMRDYITVEIENAAKPFDKLWELRVKRYARKYETMAANDAITITPGVTELTPELAAILKSRFDNICNKMTSLNRQLGKSISKLDDAARNDVVYIFSNCWYFLQSFENVPEMRSYLMSLTDDTRKNLKL